MKSGKIKIGNIEAHFPVPDDDEVSSALRRLVKAIHDAKLTDQGRGFGFGGEYGYGVDFENDVFEMHWDRQHPACDCGGSMPKHKAACDMVTMRDEWFDAKMKAGIIPEDEQDGHGNLSFDRMDKWMRANPFPPCSCGEDASWRAAHPGVEPNDDGFESPHPSKFPHERGCDWSIVYRPQFTHKPSGSTVEWYKYIGRDMETDLKAPWPKIVSECRASIRKAKAP